MKYQEIALIDNKGAHNFELWVEGKKSFIDYKQRGDKVYILHTEVPEELEGKGVAAALVEKTLRYLDENQFRLVPLCSYTQLFLRRHPEWYKLVDDSDVQ
ncbi:GNAT family N-acetyltransferase [Desertivirga brevis]|uniref:GNAT family N-acetyltransferase n=1 Tax=Desertivirga brevis TaxID=2810310 RepID=UPI001A971AFD|nr:GNAT family N-acetyltransferase [Pedobacter sp. SYSU D00873]